MSGSTFGSFEIGRRAIHVMQKGAQVTGQNIANAGTDGYTRQILHMEALVPAAVPGVLTPPGYGVDIADIDRIRSRFYDLQITSSLSKLNYWESLSDTLGAVEVIYQEPGDRGINICLSEFFDAWQDLSVQPENHAARVTLREQTDTLISVLGETYDRLDEFKFDLYQEISVAITGINALAREISELNQKITFLQAIGQKSNELFDERDLRLQELSEQINISYFEKGNGAVEVLAAGQILVQDERYHPLEMKEFTDKETLQDYILLFNRSDSPLQVAGGKLAGLLQSYNTELFTQQRALDELVFTLVQEINSLHREGFGLEGGTGVNFFEPWDEIMPGEIVIGRGESFHLGRSLTDLRLASTADSGKMLSGEYIIGTAGPLAGGPLAAEAAVTATYGLNSDQLIESIGVDADNQLNASLLFEVTKVGHDHVYVHYYVRYTDKQGAASYGEGVKELFTGTANDNSYISMDGWQMDLDLKLTEIGNFSVGDKFVVSVMAEHTENDNALTLSYDGGADIHNVVLEKASSDYTMNTLRFFQLDGRLGEHRDVILDVTAGVFEDEADAATFQVGPYMPENINEYIHRSTLKIRLSEEVHQNLSSIAAAAHKDAAGDGGGALAIAGLRDALLMQGGRATLQDFFRGLIAELGVKGQESERMQLAMGAVTDSIMERRESVSGVSLDDEMINLIQFQHSYNAAASFLSTIDEMLEMLIATLGR